MVITGKGYGFVTFSTSESVEQLLEMKELPTAARQWPQSYKVLTRNGARLRRFLGDPRAYFVESL